VSLSRDEALSAVPRALRNDLLRTFDEIVAHYRARRWEPSELNGGKFCEVVYSILRGHVDRKYPKKATKPNNMVDACKALEQETTFPRSVRIQIPRMLVALYEIRNSRNVGHVGGDVDPNHMDAVSVLAMARWILAELVRVFHDLSADGAEILVEALTTRDVPAIWEVGDTRRVLVPSLPTKDAALLLLYASPAAVADAHLISWLEYGNASRFRAGILKELHSARLVEYDRKAGTVQISPTGITYVEVNLPLHV
jgi:hypothetical protein